MTCSMRVLGTECWSKCINIAKALRHSFALQLSCWGQERFFAHQLIGRTQIVIFCINILRGYAKQVARTLAIARCDNRSMCIHKSTTIEKLVYSKGQLATHSVQSTKQICAWTQIRIITQIFYSLAFFLYWICTVCSTIYLYLFCINLVWLFCSLSYFDCAYD